MLLCGRCRKPLEPDHECLGLTRRFFFGLFAGAGAAMAVPDVWGKAELLGINQEIHSGDYIYNGWGRKIGFSELGKRTFSLAGTGSLVPKRVAHYLHERPDVWYHQGGEDLKNYVVRRPKRPFWMREHA
jgi:hypothetical protein